MSIFSLILKYTSLTKCFKDKFEQIKDNFKQDNGKPCKIAKLSLSYAMKLDGSCNKIQDDTGNLYRILFRILMLVELAAATQRSMLIGYTTISSSLKRRGV